MGAVYVVDQMSTGKQRALKLMAPELVHNPDVRERFVREAKAAANIESDHVVETVTAGVDETTGAPYIVMELLRGEELADVVLRSGPLSVADVAEVLAQIGHALEQAHAQGLVHRDLKPENIFLCVSRRREAPFTAKILDFGIAKLVADGMQKTGTQPLGSPLYMAPEQTDRKGKICPATDVWALGLVTFFLLTGKSYWRGAEGESLNVLLREIIVDPIVPPSERAKELGVTGELPQGFDAWFVRCVDRDVDRRYAEAGEAVRAFAEITRGVASERKLVVRTGAVDASSGGLATSEIETAVTAYVAEPAVPKAAADKGATGATGALAKTSVEADPTSTGAPKKGLRLWIGAAATGAVAAGLYFAVGTPPGEPAAATSAPRVSAGSSAVAAATASGARSVAAGASAAPPYAPPAAPDDPRCPKGTIYHAAGSTVMGAKDMPEHTAARATHEVALSAFCLDQIEVTVRAYEQCVQAGACERTPDDVDFLVDGEPISDALRAALRPLCNARKPDRLDHPINCADWKMAQRYCAWRSARLPTEAEWEYAARGAEQRDYPWGSDPPDARRLNVAGVEFATWAKEKQIDGGAMHGETDGFAGTAPVGSFPAGATPNGVHDLAGNVFEWTSDWFSPYAAAPAADPTGPPSGQTRVARGGAFNSSDPLWVRGAYRWGAAPNAYNHGIGFRCAAEPNGETKPARRPPSVPGRQPRSSMTADNPAGLSD
jgi:formylglycine-generating enzyme required for sulfatase activity/tRNA A-37 threonylcarbamoyl transferase component Bud32